MILTTGMESVSGPTLVGAVLLLLTALGMGATWGGEITRKMPLALRWRAAWLGGLTVTVSGILSWGMLAALPRLGLSFGAVAIGQLGLTLLSMLVLLAAAVVYKYSGRFGWFEQNSGSLLRVMQATWAAQGLIFLLAGYSLYYEPFNLQVTHVSADGPAFLADRPLRVLQVSDLHVERITKRESAVLDQMRALQPDLIVLTGDYLNLDYLNDPTSLKDARWFLSQLQAPFGVYAVQGSVDGAAMMEALFRDLEIQVLDDQMQTLALPGGNLALIGVANLERGRDGEVLSRLVGQVEDNDFGLLLYHTPDLAEKAAAFGIDLYLAGHTHGGQIRMPFYGAVVTFSAYGKRFEAGEYWLDGMQLYVSRGLGMEGFGMPRARLLCPPELVFVEIGGGQP